MKEPENLGQKTPSEALIAVLEDFGQKEPSNVIILWKNDEGEMCSVRNSVTLSQAFGMLTLAAATLKERFVSYSRGDE
jgi:hypothetical protein